MLPKASLFNVFSLHNNFLWNIFPKNKNKKKKNPKNKFLFFYFCLCCFCFFVFLLHFFKYISWRKKLDSNYTRTLRADLNKSWRQHLTKQRLYGHLPPIMKTIKVRRTRHAGYCWRSKDEHISDMLLWTPSHERAKAGWPARTYIWQLCTNTGCSLEDLLGSMADRDGWRERVRQIHSGSATW